MSNINTEVLRGFYEQLKSINPVDILLRLFAIDFIIFLVIYLGGFLLSSVIIPDIIFFNFFEGVGISFLLTLISTFMFLIFNYKNELFQIKKESIERFKTMSHYDFIQKIKNNDIKQIVFIDMLQFKSEYCLVQPKTTEKTYKLNLKINIFKNEQVNGKIGNVKFNDLSDFKNSE